MEVIEPIDYVEAEKHRLALDTNIYSQPPLCDLIAGIKSGLPDEVLFDDNNLLQIISSLLHIILGPGINDPKIRIRKFRGLEKEQRLAEYKLVIGYYRRTINESLARFETTGYYKKSQSITLEEHKKKVTVFIDLVLAELGKIVGEDDIIALAYLRSCKDEESYGLDGLPIQKNKFGALKFEQFRKEFLLTDKFQADHVPFEAPDRVVGLPVYDPTIHFRRDRFGKRYRTR